MQTLKIRGISGLPLLREHSTRNRRLSALLTSGDRFPHASSQQNGLLLKDPTSFEKYIQTRIVGLP
jgi:hypothetical protein